MSKAPKEIEIKLWIKEKLEFADIQAFFTCMDIAPWELTEMQAVYYDTPRRLLNKEHIAYRIRRENDKFVATCKLESGYDEQGMVQRIEINREVSSSAPDFSVFADARELPKGLVKRLEKKRFIAEVETNFIRLSAVVNYGSSQIEVAYDRGVVSGKGQEAPINELELEILSGDTADLVELSQSLQNCFALEVGTISKFARGLALAKLSS